MDIIVHIGVGERDGQRPVADPLGTNSIVGFANVGETVLLSWWSS
jgi:hypothetical protein